MDLALGLLDLDAVIDVALYLINRGCGDEEGKAKLLSGACKRGKLNIVKHLVRQHKCDPKSECWMFNLCRPHYYTFISTVLRTINTRTHLYIYF